jgi:hypothetical protein
MRAFSFAFIGAIVGTIFTTMLVLAWTGPTSPPSSGNVAAPLNVGTTDQIKEAGLGLDALAVFGNAILSGTSRYLNFGDGAGENGYGLRDNAGTMEFKNTGGTWSAFLASTTAGATASDTVGGGCTGDSSWGNAIDCLSEVCDPTQIAGSCPADYFATRTGRPSVQCTGGLQNNCGCGVITSGVPGSGTQYKASYYPAPMLCLKD